MERVSYKNITKNILHINMHRMFRGKETIIYS